ncbi:MAG: hypothetical protein ABJG78_11075 [Cyclobacteriaceae bacterium]
MILLLTVALVPSLVQSQIKFNVKVSDRNLGKVEKQKDPREKLKSYKKFYSKDSLKAAKIAWKDYRRLNKDSLKREGVWKEAKANKGKILNGRWDTYTNRSFKLDSLSLPPPKDSLDWALRELAIQGEFEQIQDFYREYAQYDSAYLDQFKMDSLQFDSLELARRFDAKQQVRSYLPEELAQETDADVANQMKAGTIDEFGVIQKIDKSGVKDFFKNVSPEQFAESQLSMKAAKTKFSSLSDLEKEEEGIKRNSLEGSPFKKRLFLGGHITIQATSPLILDSDIRVGYKFNKKFSAGAGLILREQFSDRTTSLTGDAHGYSLFTSYDLTETYFLYGEYQAVKNRSLFQESNDPINWEYAYLLGTGRKFRFSSKLSGSLSLLYDFNFKNNDLNSRPLVVRFGYQIDL